MNRRGIWCMALGAALAGGLPCARAAVEFTYVTDKAAYAGAPTSEVEVKVSLRETVTGADTSLLVSEGGIFGADVQASTTGTATITGMTDNTGLFTQLLSAATDPETLPAGGVSTGAFSMLALDDPGPMGTLAGNTRTLYLGSFTIDVGDVIGRVSTFIVSDWPGGTNTYTNRGTALDSLIQPASFTVTVLAPEPLTAVPVAAGVLGLLLRRRRRA